MNYENPTPTPLPHNAPLILACVAAGIVVYNESREKDTERARNAARAIVLAGDRPMCDNLGALTASAESVTSAMLIEKRTMSDVSECATRAGNALVAGITANEEHTGDDIQSPALHITVKTASADNGDDENSRLVREIIAAAQQAIEKHRPN